MKTSFSISILPFLCSVQENIGELCRVGFTHAYYLLDPVYPQLTNSDAIATSSPSRGCVQFVGGRAWVCLCAHLCVFVRVSVCACVCACACLLCLCCVVSVCVVWVVVVPPGGQSKASQIEVTIRAPHAVFAHISEL